MSILKQILSVALAMCMCCDVLPTISKAIGVQTCDSTNFTIPSDDYRVINEEMGLVEIGEDGTLTLETNIPYKFYDDSVDIDGCAVASEECYSVWESDGGTVITLNAELVTSLSPGYHSVRVWTKDEVLGTFIHGNCIATYFCKGTKYEVISGNCSTVTSNGFDVATFEIDAPFEKFDGIEFYGEKISPISYTASASDRGTIITLNAEYLATLTPTSENRMWVCYRDGGAEAYFSVVEESKDELLSEVVYLETLQIANSDRYTGNRGDSCINVLGTRNGTVDIYGNQMEHGLEAWIARWNFEEESSWAWIEYKLEAQYTNLSGKLTLITDCYNSTDFDSTIEIIADGIILFTSSLTPGMEVVSVDVDISGVNMLRISVYDNKAVKGGTSFGLWDFAVSTDSGVGGECNHQWNLGVEAKAPTCTEGGEVEYTCAICGETKTEDTLPVGHKFVERICSRCGKRDFSLKYDVWSFDNSYNSYGPASEGYYISYADYQRLISNLTQTERYALLIREKEEEIGNKGAISVIKKRLSNYNINNAFTNEQCVDWAGSCYGMSTWVCLNSYGIRKASDINGYTDSLYFYDNRLEVESAINYYHFQQCLDRVNQTKKECMSLTQQDQIERLQKLGKQANESGKTFLICFRYYSGFNPDGSCDTTTSGGHAVVGYGWEEIEPREISVLDTKYIYTNRILIYDCADPQHTRGDRNIYYNDDGVWCIPGYQIVSDNSKTADDRRDNANLEIITRDVSSLNGVDYISGKCAPLVAITTLETVANTPYIIECNGIAANISGFTVTSETKNHGIIVTGDYNITTDGTPISIKSTAILPDADSYTVVSENESLSFSLHNENYLTSCTVGASGRITFCKDGMLSVFTDEPTTYYLNFVANDGHYNLPWYQIEIAGENASEISVEKIDDGIVVKSDNLDIIVVAVTDDSGTVEIVGSSENEAILISQTKSIPAIYEDADGDGVYETDISHMHYYGNPEFLWSEENACTTTFTCAVCNDIQTIECTVVSTPMMGTKTVVYTATVEFNGGTYTDTRVVGIPGDVNGDGKVNGKDGVLLAQYLAGRDVTIITDAADVNGDGKINGKDGVILAQYLAGWGVILHGNV